MLFHIPREAIEKKSPSSLFKLACYMILKYLHNELTGDECTIPHMVQHGIQRVLGVAG